MRVRFAPSPTGALHIGGARTALFNWLLRPPRRRRAGAAHRGHRPRALDAGERRADHSTLCAGWSSTGTRGRSCRPSAPSATARRCERCSTAGTPTAPARPPRTSRPTSSATAPSAASAASPRPRGGAAARARRGRDGRARRRPRRHALRARPHGRSRDRARRRLGALQLRGRDRRPRRCASRTSCAARTTSRTRPSSCSCWRPRGPSGSTARRPARDAHARTAHLPLLHGPDGKKLSKRHGAASVQELRDAGYLPEAVRNYLALLGWGAGDDQTVLVNRGAGRALRARPRQPQPGAL